MPTITINVETDQMAEKVAWLLEHFENDGVEILSREDAGDLKALRATRGEEAIPLDEYLQSED